MFKHSCLFFFLAITVNATFGQCPVATGQFRNNGNGGTCFSTDAPPTSSSTRTGRFTFDQAGIAFPNNQYLDKVLYNGQLYQLGTTLYTSYTIWFGGYNAPTRDLCFYGTSGSNNAVPAGQWQLFFRDAVTGVITSCTYAITSGGNASNFAPGSIGTDQTICSGTAPVALTNVSSPSGCSSSATYQWQSSTVTATSGFTDIAGATSATYSPGTLTTTTYYMRIATCPADGVPSNSNVVTVNVLNAGTISPSTGFTWNASTTSPTFTSNGNSGGTWTSSNPNIAIGSTSGVLSVLTPPASGTSTTTTITYRVSGGGVTCTTTRLVTITNNNGTLPVTWSDVLAEKSGGMVLVKWSTVSENNTKDFVVQYSTNTQQWAPLATITAAGNSTSLKNYSYLHQNPLKGSSYNYYRILQRDLDDKFSYSKIVSILFNEPGSDLIVYPNPARDVVTVYVASAGEVKLLNAAGALVWKGFLPAGNSQLPVKHLSKGVYVVSIGNKSTRLIID